MKKFILPILTALLFVCLPNSLFAADFSVSAGGGGLLGYTFTRYTMEGENLNSIQNMDRLDYAGFLFFDAAYAEFSVIIQAGKNSYKENMVYYDVPYADSKGTGNETSLGFSLLGKYPFTINETLKWFPLFGVEYQIALIQRRHPDGDFVYDRSKGQLPEDRDKDDKQYSISAWNSFWIDVGAGLDYNITSSLFLRGELLFGFRLPTSYEMGALEKVQNPPLNVKNPNLTGLTGSPDLKIGIGYHF